MPKFIELTYSKDKYVLLNVDNIAAIYPRQSSGTSIQMSDSESEWTVQESYDTVKAMLMEVRPDEQGS